MLKTDWLLGLALVALITPACTTKTSLGSEGDDGGRDVASGLDTPPATGCTYAPVSLDLSCNDDPNLPTAAGGCEPGGTCRCAPGFVLNPVSKRCKLAPTVDGGAVICTVGADQTCNDDPLSAQITGTCVGGVACACKTGYLMNVKTGRCKRAPVTDAGSDALAGVVCTPLLDQTCNDDDTFGGTAGKCTKGFSCSCNDGFVVNPATGRCRAGSKPDAAVTPDSPGGRTCLWQDPGILNGLKRFRFLLTTPDGQAQTPRKSVDAGAWPINDFQGRVVEKTGNQLTIDSCLTPATCQASLYRFVVCEGTACSAQASPGNINVPISVGRLVRVVWHLDSDNTAFCPGIFWLAIYDAEPGDGQGNLLFLGSGGRRPEEAQSPRNYMADLPFSVAVEALPCGFPGVSDAPGDFSFVFSPKGGSGATLKLATGENGSFEFAVAGSDLQRLQVHSLVAVQPEVTDSYWNWDFWMAADSTPTPVDAGSNDASGVCTFGKNQTCNDEPWASWVAGTCQSNGTCVCASGYVMNPSSGRCAYVPKDAGPDITDSKTACTPGMDQTCGDGPAALWGTCQANGTCLCKDGYVINPSTGKCMIPGTNACSGSYDACGCGCCGTPPAVCYYPSAGDSLSAIKSADEAVKNDKAKCEMAGCSMGQRYLCCAEAAAEPAGSAQYGASFIAGGYDRISIKKTGNDGNCMQLTLLSPVPTGSSSNPFRVSTPTRWAIEAPIFKSTCGSSGTAEQAIGAQGSVTYVPNGTSCALGAHLTVFFYSAATGNISTARFDAEDIPVSGGVSSGYCR